MTDHYAYYRSALAGEPVEIHADHPQCGIYKARRNKNSPFRPVIIWFDKEGVQRAKYGDEPVDPLKVWTHCANRPVSKPDFEHYKEHGRFPGEIEAGHNSGELSLAAEIEDAAAQAREWADKNEIKDKVTADTCANMRQRLLDLAKKADSERDGKKRPHLDAGRAIDAEYKPLVDTAKEAADLLRAELTAYMVAEDRRAKEAYEEKKRAAAAAAPDDEPPLFPAAPPPTQAGGQAGRKAGLRDVPVFEIDNYDVLCAEFCEHESVRDLILKLATQRAKTGVVVPGLKRSVRQVAA